MAKHTSSSSSTSNTGYPSFNINEYTKYSIWDYHFETFPSDSVNKAFGSGPSTEIEQLISLGQEFDSSWDFRNELEELNRANVVARVEGNSTVAANVVGVEEEEPLFRNQPLSLELVSQYFHLREVDAAKKLQVGETYLKKCCRKLGIPRWPFKKMRSLERLANNVKQFGKFTGEDEKRKVVKELENKRGQVLIDPNLELSAETLRLRNSCFRKKYKKKKYRDMLDLYSSNSLVSSSSGPPLTIDHCSKVDDED